MATTQAAQSFNLCSLQKFGSLGSRAPSASQLRKLRYNEIAVLRRFLETICALDSIFVCSSVRGDCARGENDGFLRASQAAI